MNDKHETRAAMNDRKDHEAIVHHTGGHVRSSEGPLTSNLYLYRKNKNGGRQKISDNICVVWAK
jgi:hypothetical protein